MSRYNIIKLSDVLSRIKWQLQLTDDSNDDYLEILINEGLRHLDCLYLLKKQQCKLEIHDNKVKLPSGFFKLLAARLSGDDTNGECTSMTYIDRNFLSNCGCSDYGSYTINDYSDSFQINNGYIYFNNTVEAEYLELAYMGLNVDEDGRILIMEDMERALMNYACYMFSLSRADKYSQYVIESYKRAWVAQKNWLRGQAARQDFERTRFQMRMMFNALAIHGPLYVLETDL